MYNPVNNITYWNELAVNANLIHIINCISVVLVQLDQKSTTTINKHVRVFALVIEEDNVVQLAVVTDDHFHTKIYKFNRFLQNRSIIVSLPLHELTILIKVNENTIGVVWLHFKQLQKVYDRSFLFTSSVFTLLCCAIN